MAIRKLCPALQEIAEKELNETSERIKDDLMYIREWLRKQPHLKVRTDDQTLIAFLRGCKFSLQRTQEKLDYYYTAKTILTEFYSNRDPYDPDIQEVLKLGPILPLPNTASASSPRIILFNLAALDPDKVSYISFIKVQFMILDILLQEDDHFVVAGVEIWSEMKNASMRYAVQLTPTVVRKTNAAFEKGYPLRMKKHHCTHCPPIAAGLFNLSKSLVSDKLSKRMFLYSENNMDKFYQQVSKYLQPKDFGGENGSLKELTEFWKQKVESYRNWFLEDSRYGTREELRVGIPKTSANMFGVEGTFRQLTVD
ncbi:hypothetical protein RI129_004630 [Pyrocoelia pectoralis]|uniref:CRAL-TRIO domain-containing protein n=1 Tax=Pyrocoelia pectoralis TaxID=417401 RepID=A0AAN7VIK7_9COLE